jgi:hypothetical protein
MNEYFMAKLKMVELTMSIKNMVKLEMIKLTMNKVYMVKLNNE